MTQQTLNFGDDAWPLLVGEAVVTLARELFGGSAVTGWPERAMIRGELAASFMQRDDAGQWRRVLAWADGTRAWCGPWCPTRADALVCTPPVPLPLRGAPVQATYNGLPKDQRVPRG